MSAIPASSTPSSSDEPILPNGAAPGAPEFGELASDDQLEATAAALRGRGFEVVVVPDRAAAVSAILERVAPDAEVFESTSETIRELGVMAKLSEPGRARLVRPRLIELIQAGERAEAKAVAATPEIVLGSVHAVTRQGDVLVASASGSQLPAYVYGAEKVIWVVGAQKLVANLEDGLRRLYEYSLPLEDVRAQKAYGIHSAVNKILIVRGELPGRTTVILVPEKLGF